LPHAAHDDERADAIVPEIAKIEEAEIRARIGAAEASVIKDNDLGLGGASVRVTAPPSSAAQA
jgi:hypothetical protein